MPVLLLLIIASLAIAATFLVGFILAVRAGQFDDTCTPSMRILSEENLCTTAKTVGTISEPNHQKTSI